MKGLRVTSMASAELRALVSDPKQACWYYKDPQVCARVWGRC